MGISVLCANQKCKKVSAQCKTQQEQEDQGLPHEDRDPGEVIISLLTCAVADSAQDRVAKLLVSLLHGKNVQLVNFIPDTGAEVNCISQQDLGRLSEMKVEPVETRLKMADNRVVKAKGQCVLDVVYNGKLVQGEKFVFLDGGMPLMSLCRRLQITQQTFYSCRELLQAGSWTRRCLTTSPYPRQMSS